MWLFVCALTYKQLDGLYLNLHRYLSGTAKTNLLDFGGIDLICKVARVIYKILVALTEFAKSPGLYITLRKRLSVS